MIHLPVTLTMKSETWRALSAGSRFSTGSRASSSIAPISTSAQGHAARRRRGAGAARVALMLRRPGP